MSAETITGLEADETKVARRPGRPKRSEVTKTERRRRKGGTAHKLKIPQHVIDKHPDMEFRWGRDDGARMAELTQADDWDKVPSVDAIHGGKGETGGAIKMHLLMKPKEFIRQDRAEKEQARRDLEASKLAKPDAKTATEAGTGEYIVPGSKI